MRGIKYFIYRHLLWQYIFLNHYIFIFFLRKKTSNKYKYDDHFTSISACGGVRAEIQVPRRKEHPPSKQHNLEI